MQQPSRTLCFSAASMRMTKTSIAVRNASRKTPLTSVMPGERVVIVFPTSLVLAGVSPSTRAAPAIPPACGRKRDEEECVSVSTLISHQVCHSGGTHQLCDGQHDGADRVDGSDEPKSKSDGRVEESSGDSVECPSSDKERQAHSDRDLHDGALREHCRCLSLRSADRVLRRLDCSKAQEYEPAERWV